MQYKSNYETVITCHHRKKIIFFCVWCVHKRSEKLLSMLKMPTTVMFTGALTEKNAVWYIGIFCFGVLFRQSYFFQIFYLQIIVQQFIVYLNYYPKRRENII